MLKKAISFARIVHRNALQKFWKLLVSKMQYICFSSPDVCLHFKNFGSYWFQKCNIFAFLPPMCVYTSKILEVIGFKNAIYLLIFPRCVFTLQNFWKLLVSKMQYICFSSPDVCLHFKKFVSYCFHFKDFGGYKHKKTCHKKPLQNFFSLQNFWRLSTFNKKLMNNGYNHFSNFTRSSLYSILLLGIQLLLVRSPHVRFIKPHTNSRSFSSK